MLSSMAVVIGPGPSPMSPLHTVSLIFFFQVALSLVIDRFCTFMHR